MARRLQGKRMSQPHGASTTERFVATGVAIGAVVAALLLAACERPVASEGITSHPAEAPVERRQTAATPTAPLPSPARLSDAALTRQIAAAILADPGMSGADVSVNATNGVVSLTGNVRSAEQIAIASAHAQHEDGVMRVDSHLALNAR
jgi:osmotically-inducible protein OsmY